MYVNMASMSTGSIQCMLSGTGTIPWTFRVKNAHLCCDTLLTIQDEFTPEDFTVWNPRLNASIPIQFLGTPRPSRKRSDRFCVEGFDNAG